MRPLAAVSIAVLAVAMLVVPVFAVAADMALATPSEIDPADADAPETVPADPPVDLVVVFKGDRMLYLYRDGLPISSYPISLGDNPVGHKRESGDERTPEGAYWLDWRNPDSIFYKSIHVSYPDASDRRLAARRGVDPGGEIMIHGQPVYAVRPRTGDWTDGCIAVSNEAMDELWRLVPEGTRIHIFP